jgi:hypothetical protein
MLISKLLYYIVDIVAFSYRSFGYKYLKLITYASELSNFKLDENSIDHNVNYAKTKQIDTEYQCFLFLILVSIYSNLIFNFF